MKQFVHSILESNRDLLRRSSILQTLDRTLYRFALSKSQPVTVNYGAELYVNPEDMAISRRLWREGEFQPPLTRYLKQATEPTDCVVDVGANLGYFSVLMGRQMNEDGSLFALEPEPDSHCLLRQNLSHNSLSEVSTCIEAAASDRRQTTTLYKGGSNKGTHSIRGNDQASGIEIESVPLDSIIDPAVDLVKIDVEGVEDRVLSGAENIIQTDKPTVVVENNETEWQGSYRTVFGPLLDAGLNPHEIKENGGIGRVRMNNLDTIGDIVFD